MNHAYLSLSVVLFIIFVIPTGYQCEQHNNPADFFLDVIIENEESDGHEGTTYLCISITSPPPHHKVYNSLENQLQL